MKRIMLLISLAVVVIIIQSGCSDSFENDNPYVVNRNVVFSVYDCFESGDRIKLKTLLCESLRSKRNIDDQINSAFDMIGGGFKSVDKDSYTITTSGGNKNFGEYTTFGFCTHLHDLIDMNNNSYGTLVVKFNYLDKENTEFVGVDEIKLYKRGQNLPVFVISAYK